MGVMVVSTERGRGDTQNLHQKIYQNFTMAMIRCRIVLLSNTIKLNSLKIVNVVCSIHKHLSFVPI